VISEEVAMKYEIKINMADEASGTINLKRFEIIAESIRKISEGALQIRLKGISAPKRPRKVELEKALNINLTGIKKGSTCLELEAEPFEKTLGNYQMDVFRQETQKELPKLTPMSLFMNTYTEALKENPSSDLLDKPLLRELKNYRKAFLTEKETMVFSNQGTQKSITLNKATFDKIRILEEELPNPKPVLIRGKVELLKYSKQKVTIQTDEGMINGFINDDIKPEEIGKYWGKEITVAGTAHYKPGGKSIIEIDRFAEPEAGDEYFSKKPQAETVNQQIARQFQEGKSPNALGDLVGKWPGDETDEEFEQLLREI